MPTQELEVTALAGRNGLWQCPRAAQSAIGFARLRRPAVLLSAHAVASSCRSSVVEHSLGKGEVDSSILFGSTRFLRFRTRAWDVFQACTRRR